MSGRALGRRWAAGYGAWGDFSPGTCQTIVPGQLVLILRLPPELANIVAESAAGRMLQTCLSCEPILHLDACKVMQLALCVVLSDRSL